MMPVIQVNDAPPQTTLPDEHAGKLGRLADPHDPRDYQVQRLLRVAPARIQRQNARMWMPPPKKWRLDQGRTSSCVEHGIAHAIYGHPQPRSRIVPWEHFALYRRAQQEDEWAGEEPDYYGTSIRAGLHAAAGDWPYMRQNEVGGWEQAMHQGPVESYYRVEDWEDLLDLLCSDDYHLGCSIVIGTDWGGPAMYQVDKDGFLHFDKNRIDGGHCWWLHYANLKENVSGGLNSWGQNPAQSGMMVGGGFKLHLTGNDGLRALWDRGADGWVIAQRKSMLSKLARKAGYPVG